VGLASAKLVAAADADLTPHLRDPDKVASAACAMPSTHAWWIVSHNDCIGRADKEVAREGIRVNCVRPGHIYTDMHASGGEPGRVDRVKDSIPMGRGGQPEEVAQAILRLASGEASFVTGTFLDVTGGK
jgi:hypothetical protein